MIKLTEEQIDTMSYTDVAYLVLKEAGKKQKIQDLFTKVIKLLKLPESYFESKIGDFFGLLSTDQRFTMLEKGFWDLTDNHQKKVVIEDDEEEEITEEDTNLDEIESEETEDDEINYDDEDVVDDDEEEDDLKDLCIMDGEEETDMM